MTVDQYLIARAVEQAQANKGPDATHQYVVNYLHAAKAFSALGEYLRDFDTLEDLQGWIDPLIPEGSLA